MGFSTVCAPEESRSVATVVEKYNRLQRWHAARLF
jgi:hypothetical protein